MLLSFISFSIHFRILNEFLEFISEIQNPGKRKGMNSAKPESGPRPRYAGPAQRGKPVGWPSCTAGTRPCHGHRAPGGGGGATAGGAVACGARGRHRK
jgi:hypothetical protein